MPPIELTPASLEFSLPSGETFTVELIEFKLLLEEYIGDKTEFKHYGPDVINMVKQEYGHDITQTQAWLMIKAIEPLWDDLKKKAASMRTSPTPTI